MPRLADECLRQELISALDFALRFKAHGLTWKRGQRETLSRIAAEAIIGQLELSNFTFGRAEESAPAKGYHGASPTSE
jgi:hypothetical protein